jgi:hypothetical protein
MSRDIFIYAVAYACAAGLPFAEVVASRMEYFLRSFSWQIRFERRPITNGEM